MTGIGIRVGIPGGGEPLPPELHLAGDETYTQRYVASRFTDLETLAIGASVTSIPDYGSNVKPMVVNSGTPGVDTLKHDVTNNVDYIEMISSSTVAGSLNFNDNATRTIPSLTAAMVIRVPTNSTRLCYFGGARVERAASGVIQVTRGASWVSAANPGTGWAFLLVTLSAGAARVRLNAAETTGTFTDSNAAGSGALGGGLSVTSRQVDVAEAIFYETVLDSAQRTAVHNAMKAKYPFLP